MAPHVSNAYMVELHHVGDNMPVVAALGHDKFDVRYEFKSPDVFCGPLITVKDTSIGLEQLLQNANVKDA